MEACLGDRRLRDDPLPPDMHQFPGKLTDLHLKTPGFSSVRAS